MVDLAEKLPDALRDLLGGAGPVAIAFSGGLDSRFLCHAARLCGCDVLAVHARGPHVPASETDFALSFAQSHGLRLKIVEYDPLENEIVRQNGRDRCYHCKKSMFGKLAIPGFRLADGTNADDLQSYRPGLRALKEMGIFSPLARAGLGKGEIRKLAAATGLENPGQKARPCLLTRFAYGMSPNHRELENLSAAENELQKILGPQTDFRLRLAPRPILQTCALDENRKNAVDQIMRKYGFDNYLPRIEENISGFFDRLAYP